MSKRIELSLEKYETFLSVIKALKDSCTDLSIRNGMICQTDDLSKAIFKIDLSPVFGERVNLLMSSIKVKYDLLETFRKQRVPMSLEFDERGYSFQDTVSRLYFVSPVEQFINPSNRFIPQEDLDRKLSLEEEIILEYTFESLILKRLHAFVRGLSATRIMIEFKNGFATWKVLPSDKSMNTVGDLSRVEVNVDIEGIAVFTTQPFLIGVEELKSKIFYQQGKTKLLLQLTSELGNDIKVPIDIWGISNLVENNTLCV